MRILQYAIMTVVAVAAVAAIWHFFGQENNPYEQYAKKRTEEVARQEGEQIKDGVLEGFFTLEVNLYKNKHVRVRYLIPVDENNRPLPSASNLIFHAPFSGESRWLKDGFAPWQRYFAEKLKYSIFSMAIAAEGTADRGREQYYIYPEAGWFEWVFKVQDRLVKQYGLEKRPLLVTGVSAGGSMAEMMLNRYPDKIAAAAWCGGSVYEKLRADNPVPILALNTMGCAGQNSTGTLFETTRQSGKESILRAVTPPNYSYTNDHHSPGELAFTMMHTFIRDMAEMREKYGVIPPAAQWPEQMSVARRTVRLPSAGFKMLWEKIPHDPLAYTPDRLHEFPGPAHPDRIVFFVCDPGTGQTIFPLDELYYLAENGAKVFFLFAESPLSSRSEIEKGVKQIARDKTLPVYLIGSGLGGNLVARAAGRNPLSRLERITLVNPKFDNPFEELSLTAEALKPIAARLTIAHSADEPAIEEMPGGTDTAVQELPKRALAPNWMAALLAMTRSGEAKPEEPGILKKTEP